MERVATHFHIGDKPALAGMKKAELLAELAEAGIPVRPTWTVTELRTLVQENRPKKDSSLKGLGSLKSEELLRMARTIRSDTSQPRPPGDGSC